jgi:hypothetical protein
VWSASWLESIAVLDNNKLYFTSTLVNKLGQFSEIWDETLNISLRFYCSDYKFKLILMNSILVIRLFQWVVLLVLISVCVHVPHRLNPDGLSSHVFCNNHDVWMNQDSLRLDRRISALSGLMRRVGCISPRFCEWLFCSNSAMTEAYESVECFGTMWTDKVLLSFVHLECQW